MGSATPRASRQRVPPTQALPLPSPTLLLLLFSCRGTMADQHMQAKLVKQGSGCPWSPVTVLDVLGTRCSLQSGLPPWDS